MKGGAPGGWGTGISESGWWVRGSISRAYFISDWDLSDAEQPSVSCVAFIE